MVDATTRETYEKLVAKAKEANTAYYDNDDPIMTDVEYDELMLEIKKIEKEHPSLITSDSPTQYVGGTPSKSSLAKVKHAVPMLSLQDVFTKEEVRHFIEQNRGQGVSVEEKIDGLSLSVTYLNGKLVQAKTRGDAYWGEDVTAAAQFIKGIPTVFENDGGAVEELEVRCEVYLPVADFIATNEVLEREGKKLFANPRNAAAGILRTKVIDKDRLSKLSAFTFNVQRFKADSFIYNFGEDHCHDLFLLDNLGFQTVPRIYAFLEDDIMVAIDTIGKRRDSLPYWIDGGATRS